MKKRIAAIALLAALLAVAGTGVQPARADSTLQSASGFGQIHLGLPFRSFAFSATKSSDGSVTGEAQLENRSTDFRGHIAIDCLNVLGNVAVMSGVLTQSTSPNLPVGTEELFAVQDNGSGPSAPADELTLTVSGLGITCTDITDPAQLALFFVPIESGQVQVRS
jgi:hypothetical protein